MRLAVVSDTHGHVSSTKAAVRLLAAQDVEAVVHCGDIGSPAIIPLFAPWPAHFVFGNGDFKEAALRRAIGSCDGICLERGGELELGGKRIAVAHGDSAAEIRRLAAAKPDYLMFGHSHVATDEREGPTRWINPGALHRASTWTVALLDLDSDVLTMLRIRNSG